ncbi:C39 family peptidase [Enterococcus faecium]
MKKVNLIGKTVMLTTIVAGIICVKAVPANATEQDGAWEPRTVEQIKADIQGNQYTIVWGDTLGNIGEAYNITVDKLQSWNNIADANLIYAGNTLSVEGNIATVKNEAGDTISQTVITDQDKNDPTQPVGEEATTNGSKEPEADSTTNPNVGATTSSESAVTEDTATASDTTTTDNGSQSSAVDNSEGTSSNETSTPDNSGSQVTDDSQQGSATQETEKVLGVPFISQGNTMLCEGTSLLEALTYKGITNQDLMTFVNTMPISPDNNPYNGYSGEWRYNVSGTYQGMMADPVVQWAAANGGNAANITGAGSEGIKNEIRNGNPVVAWVTYQYASPEFKQMPWGNAVWNGHVVCVDGFKDGGYHVVDPVFGASWVDSTTFENSFNTTGMAVAVR